MRETHVSTRERFSALQRAENSSIAGADSRGGTACCFSALQRAENSSIAYGAGLDLGNRRTFQCSSASRKFLNQKRRFRRMRQVEFQCSSASRKFLNTLDRLAGGGAAIVSVLFSEPKIPQ